MSKNKNTPLKDEPLAQFDDVCNKIDSLEKVINIQNGYMKNVAEHGGYDSEFNFICNEFNVRQTMENALDDYLRNKGLQIGKVGEGDAQLTEAKKLLEEYRTTLKQAVDTADVGNTDGTPIKTVVIHEAAASYENRSQCPMQPQTVKGMFAFLFYRLPWYYICCFFTSAYFRRWLVIIMICMWVISICLTCIMAIDNARMHQVYRAIYMHAGT